MDRDLCKTKLIEVLRKIQTDGGFDDGGKIDGATVPLDDLEGFDSKLAPVAIMRLCRELNIDIPLDKNIFREGGRTHGRKLTVDEIASELAKVPPRVQESK